MDATLKNRKNGKTQSVPLALAMLHVLCRGNVRLSGAQVRERLLAGEMFQTPEHQIFVAEAVVRAG